jgi:transcriptional regulator with XRE-family HTH domain
MTARKRKSPPAKRTVTYEQLLRQEELLLDVTEKLSEALIESGLNRSQLAERLGKTKALVTQLLGGGRNLTLRTVADVAGALGYKVELKLTTPCVHHARPTYQYWSLVRAPQVNVYYLPPASLPGFVICGDTTDDGAQEGLFSNKIDEPREVGAA